MNKAASVKLSLRKLFVALLAIGPLAIVPSPLWAVPSTSQFSVTNGSVSLVAGSTVSTFTVSDRTVIVWSGNDATSATPTFNIPAGESWTFAGLASSGAVLNKVGYNTNGTTNGLATAYIGGNLNSTGRVFILANGNIVVNSGASIDTAGLVLSTLGETSDFNFTTQGNLSFSGASSGGITLGGNTTYVSTGNVGNSTGVLTPTLVGNITSAVGVTTGGLQAWAGAVSANVITVAGDLIVNQTSNTTAFTPVTITAGGNVTITTNNGAVGNATQLWTVANGTTTINAGTAAVAVTNQANDFGTFAANTSGTGGSVQVNDVNIITLGASSIGQDLTVSVNGTASSTAISTSGAVVVGGNATYNASVTTTSNSGISIANNSSVAGNLVMTALRNSSVSFNGVGNVILGAISAGTTAAGNRTSIAVTTNGTITGAAVTINSGGGNITSGGAITLQGASVNVSAATITAGTAGLNGSVTLNATAGNITTGAITSNSAVTLNASAGSVNSSAQTGVITTQSGINALAVRTSSTGSADLSGANVLGNLQVVTFNGGNLTLVNNAASTVVLGTTNATGNVSINATGAATTGINIGNGLGTSGQSISIGGVLTANAVNGAITDTWGTSYSYNSNTVTVGGNYSPISIFGNVNLGTGGGAITINSARQNGGSSPLVQVGAITANTLGTGAVILAETSTLNIASVNATTLTATSVSGNIIQSGAIQTTGATTANVSSTGTIALTNGNNTFASLGMSGGTDASATSNSATFTLNAPSTAPTNTTITSSGSTKNITVGTGTYNNLTVNSGGVTDISGVVTVNGNLSLTAGAANNALAVPYTLLGTPSVTATITSNSVSAVTVSGNRNIAFTVAPTITATTQTNTSGVVLTASTASDGTLATPTITNAGTPTNTATAVVNNITVTGGNVGGNVTESAGSLIVVGTTTVNSPAVLSGANDFQGGVVLGNVSGWTLVNDVNNLTVSGNSSALVTAQAGGNNASIANTWALSLGNLNVSSLTGIAGNGGGGNSGSVSQATGSVLHVENTAAFTTSTGNIIVANAGNSAGRVQLSTGGGNATITYTEDGTVKLGNINNGNGTVTITARNGSIIEDVNGNNTYTNNGTLSLQAVNGSILLGNTTLNSGNITNGNLTTITANAPGGTVALFSNTTNLTLSTINANALTVNNTGAGNLTQSGVATIFGTANITSGANVTLGNTSNNFGPIVINATGTNKNVSITESGTMNLRTVAMVGGGNGTFTATSVNGDIISSGFGGVRPGGNQTSSGGSTGTGVVTLAATKGNITVGDATTDFPTTGGVVFNGNNVSLTVLGNSTLTLGANATASVAGNLAVTSAIGSIANAGNISVTGNAAFTTGNGNISLNQAGNQFGTLKFSGNQVNVIQANDMKILTGSSAIGASSLASSGAISIVNVGGVVSFGNTLSMIATGNITLPKLIQVANTLTVNAAGTKDLSALSIAGDLGSKTPVNLGTGAYSGPQP